MALILSMTPGMLRMRLSSQVVSVISRIELAATIVALRSSFCSTPTSPKKSPGPSVATA